MAPYSTSNLFLLYICCNKEHCMPPTPTPLACQPSSCCGRSQEPACRCPSITEILYLASKKEYFVPLQRLPGPGRAPLSLVAGGTRACCLCAGPDQVGEEGLGGAVFQCETQSRGLGDTSWCPRTWGWQRSGWAGQSPVTWAGVQPVEMFGADVCHLSKPLVATQLPNSLSVWPGDHAHRHVPGTRLCSRWAQAQLHPRHVQGGMQALHLWAVDQSGQNLGFQKLPGQRTLPSPLVSVGTNWVHFRLLCPSLGGGGWGWGQPPRNSFISQDSLSWERAREQSIAPSLLRGLIFLEPLSQRAHWLWQMGVRMPHLDHLGVGVPPPHRASARMLIERRDWLLSMGSPRLGQRPLVGGAVSLCPPLTDEPKAQALCPSPTLVCVSVGPMPCPTRESAVSTWRRC